MKKFLTALVVIAFTFSSCDKVSGDETQGGEEFKNNPNEAIVTGAATDVSYYSARLSGWCNQKGDKGASVLFGIEYSLSDLTLYPTTVQATAIDADNRFCCTITDLRYNSVYYYRSYVYFNGIKTYGKIESFTTKGISSVTTGEVTSIGCRVAKISGIAAFDEPTDEDRCSFSYGIEYTSDNDFAWCGTCIADGKDSNNSFYCELRDLIPNTHYRYRTVIHSSSYPYCLQYGEERSFTTNASSENSPAGSVAMGTVVVRDDGSEYEIFWAECDLGATKPGEVGDKYAWGETTSKGVDESTYDKYTYTENPSILPKTADAASVNLGGKWRMATEQEWRVLLDDRITEMGTEKIGAMYYPMFTSKITGKSIILPACDWYEDNQWYSSWTSSGVDDSVAKRVRIILSNTWYTDVWYEKRYICLPIRPVTE